MAQRATIALRADSLMAVRALKDWETIFATAIQKIPSSEINRAGALLPLVPEHAAWDKFISAAKAEWKNWKDSLWQHPACLLMLYGGLAFYEYDENTFWPLFADSVGSKPLPANEQQEINSGFARAAKYFHLGLKHRDKGTDFVGSAIHYIGVPLSLWDGFLDICEWALWRKDWKAISDEEWNEAVERRAGGRRRLRKFLTDNRGTASNLVHEMLDAREILTRDTSLTISDIAQATLLRTEYFDEVPETAEFLRPQNPDSLFQNRARLIWNEQRKQVCLQVPGVEQKKLPATWRIGAHSQTAAHAPDELILNSEAFRDQLLLTLESGERTETQRLRGITSWGLFDMESGGRLANSGRDELPVKSYTLISRNRIEILREGFDEDENPVNEPFELADGSPCFVTRLWPTGKFAEIKINETGRAQRIVRFKARSRIEARFFIGWGHKAAYFSRSADNRIKTDHLPILCVAIPTGYFRDNDTEVTKNFKVFIDSKVALGQWEHRDVQAPADCEFYYWRWNKRPFLERKPGPNIVKSFDQMREMFKSPDLRGNRTIVIEALPHIHVKFDIEIVHRSKDVIDRSWRNLPGSYLPMFLLCQSTEGMKWEDLVLARDVLAHGLQLSPYLLHKYEHHGFLVQRGHRWFINESRAEIRRMTRDQCLMKFCGDPSVLWGLYRRLSQQMHGADLPLIEVINNRGEIPYLQIAWPLRMRSEIEQHLRNHNVAVGAILWNR